MRRDWQGQRLQIEGNAEGDMVLSPVLLDCTSGLTGAWVPDERLVMPAARRRLDLLEPSWTNCQH